MPPSNPLATVYPRWYLTRVAKTDPCDDFRREDALNDLMKFTAWAIEQDTIATRTPAGRFLIRRPFPGETRQKLIIFDFMPDGADPERFLFSFNESSVGAFIGMIAGDVDKHTEFDTIMGEYRGPGR